MTHHTPSRSAASFAFVTREQGAKEFGRQVLRQDVEAAQAALAQHPADGWAASRMLLVTARCKRSGEHRAQSEAEGGALLTRAAYELGLIVKPRAAWRTGEGVPPDPAASLAAVVDVLARYWVPGVQAAHRGRLTALEVNEALHDILTLADSARRCCMGPLPARITALVVEAVVMRAFLLLVGTAHAVGAGVDPSLPIELRHHVARLDVVSDEFALAIGDAPDWAVNLRKATLRLVESAARHVDGVYLHCGQAAHDADGQTADEFIARSGGTLGDLLAK